MGIGDQSFLGIGDTLKCFPATTGPTTLFLLKAEIFLHSLIILQAKTSSLELTVAQGALNAGPGRMNALAVQQLHKLPCKHRTGLLGQPSSVMKFMGLLLCLKSVCSGHPTDGSICTGKPPKPGCAY